MFVRDCMTRDPVTVRPESDPLAAIAIMKCGNFRRLPVVNEENVLVGIVTRPDLEVFLSKTQSPGIMKRQHRVDQAMNQNVTVVSLDCPLEEAASLMVEHKIGSLPVVEGNQVIGIITETDIFKQFAAVLGGGTESLRLTVQVPDIPGQLAELANRIARIGGNISSIVAYNDDQPEHINITLRVEGTDQEALLEAVANQVNLTVLHVWSGDPSS